MQMKLSKTQRYAAYTLDTNEGSEMYRAFVRHIELGTHTALKQCCDKGFSD